MSFVPLSHRPAPFLKRDFSFSSQSKSSVKNFFQPLQDRALWTIDEDASVYDATAKMVNNKVGSLCVTRAGEVVGILTERDYLRKVVHAGKSSREARVRDIATMETANLVVASEEDCVEDCVTVMASRSIRHLPVADSEGNVLGLLSIRDIAKALAEERQVVSKKLDELRLKEMPIHDG